MALLKKILFWLAVIVTLLLGIWVGRDNSQDVLVTLLGFQLPELPLGVLVIGVFLFGVISGGLLTLPSSLRYRRAAKRYRRRLLEVETRLAKTAIQQR